MMAYDMRISDWSSHVFSSDLPFGEHIGEDVAVRATLGVGQIGARRSPALAAFLRHLIEADALLRGVVEIAVDRDLQPSRGFDEIVGTGMRILLIAQDRKSVV